MRFVLGIIIGGLGTLWVASAMDMPTSNLMRSSQQIWSSFKSTQISPKSVRTQTHVQQAIAAETTPNPTATPLNTTTPALDTDTDTERVKVKVTDTVAETTVTEPLDPIPTDPLPTTLQQAEVWSAFHSEASATGFANRLTAQLDHPFYVVKSGPANYQVTYAFRDPQEQARLTAEIAALTGADNP